jgi:hypothetical protein
MNLSKVLDPEPRQESTKLQKGDKLTIQGFKIKRSTQHDADLVEIQTTEGLRHSFGKMIVGQARGKSGEQSWWAEQVAKCVAIDATDGLDARVVEKIAEPSGRPMLALEPVEAED